ncbi:ESCRT-I complex subunit VPS37 [Entomortierella parvispora]|uniref:ESCRT-I complex subunit VPS37 n=1 Tax=Entomortierella parvispora TaxID=205924 RepID=A0A9P3LT84_9FUNG|nr:ESCRT-I complex subunit VPS37 [Entomortierella parvispora]
MDRLYSNWGRKTTNDDQSQREPRKKQVDSLFTELPALRAVPNDDSRFQLTLTLSSGPDTPHLTRTTSSPSINSKAQEAGIGSNANNATATATLTVYLPPSFPEDEPKITIQPTVRHLWVDGTVQPCAVTGHERLMPGGWSTHANLGRIVKEIATNIQRTGVLVGEPSDPSGANNNNNSSSSAYDEYSHKPPPPVPNARSKSLGLNNDRSTPSYNSKTNGSQFQGQAAGNRFNQPQHMTSSSASLGSSPAGDIAYGSSLSEETRIVLELPAEKVDELLENPIAFEHFVDHLDVVVNSRTLQAEWWGGNNNVARRNLALEAEMRDLQGRTAEGHKMASQLQKTLEEKLQQQQDALWRFKPESLQSKLKAAVAESEDLSESVAQLFLEGKLDQDGFIKQYRELRKVYHLREMKNERIGAILRSQSNLPASSSGSSGSGSGNNLVGGLGSTSGMDSISSRPGMGGVTGSSSAMMSPGILSSLGGLSLSTNSVSGIGSGSISSGGLGSAGVGNGGTGSASPKEAWEVL